MESDDIPRTQMYTEEIDTRFNLKIIKKKFKYLSENIDEDVCVNKSSEPLKKNNFPQLFATVESNPPPTDPTITFDDTDENDDGDEEMESKPKLDHLKTFIIIHNLNVLYGWVLGLAVCNTWKYNNGTRWTKFMLIFGTSMTIYSHFVVISEPAKLIEVFSIFGIVAPAFLKFNLFVKSWRSILTMNTFLEEVFKLNSDGPKAHVLKKHIDETFTSIKIFILIQTMGLIIFACYPLYVFIANNELISIMPMQFPFLDQNTTFGFIMANLMMGKMGIWAYFGSVGFDLFLARSISNYSALVKLIQQDLVEYAYMWKKNDEYSEQYKNEFLRNILLKCQNKDRYIQFVNNLFGDIIFKQISVLYVCLIFTLYAIIRSNWYSGFGFLLFCVTEIYILCLLGTTIKTENDNLCFSIYSMPWYEYPISVQKTLMFLLHSSQNSMEFWIGPFAPLNVETGMELTKSIYSTSTMILNTSE